jgi:hypothetical protein
MSQFDQPVAKKRKLKLWRLPRIEDFLWKGVPPPLAFLVFLHMFFGPACFYIKPHSMVLHVFFIPQKTMFFEFKAYLTTQHRVKPCGKTTLFHRAAKSGPERAPDSA